VLGGFVFQYFKHVPEFFWDSVDHPLPRSGEDDE
jgi:hypothetical protein